MKQPPSAFKHFSVALRGSAAAGFVWLLAMNGCSDEVGGDGYRAPRATAGKGNSPAAGGMAAGGAAEGGMGGDDDRSTAGIAGKGAGGSGGMNPTAGTGGTSIAEGGMGGEGEPPLPTSVCGNKLVEAGEDCDDGNTKSGDGCTADCRGGCEQCEKTYCAAVRSHEAGDYNWLEDSGRTPRDVQATCFQMEGMAAGGPGQGVPRAELCLAMVDCVRRERCAQVVEDDFDNFQSSARNYAILRCWCDVDVTDPNYITICSTPAPEVPSADPSLDAPHFVAGKCYRQIQEASEKDDFTGVIGGVTSGFKPQGAADLLLQACDRKLCTEECLPKASLGAVAQISADILQTANLAGESPLGNLIADAQRAATGTDFAIVNRDTFTGPASPLGLFYKATPGRPADSDGRVLESELRHVLFGMDTRGDSVNSLGGSQLVTMKLTGQQLFDILSPGVGQPPLSVSGLTYTWGLTNTSGTAATQVTAILKGGVAIDKAASYSVTVNDYLVNLSDLADQFDLATDVVTTDKNCEVALVSYVKALPQPIAPPALNRITLAP